MYKILLVEDDFALAEALASRLANFGHEVSIVHDLSNVTEEFSLYNPHLVLLDIMLPFKDGYYWCREIRKISSVPIVFISSASDNMNIIMAINMGGDDFISKPVDPMVLLAKINATLRRTYEFSGDQKIVEFYGAKLNLLDYTVEFNGKLTDLTKNEFRILQTMIENRGKIVSRSDLMMKLWQDDCYVEENTLTVNVARLRKKLESIGLFDIIHTKTGSGYIIS